MNTRIFLSPPWMSGNELPLIEEAFKSNYIAPCGPMVDRFEREFAAAVGVPYACAVSSGTAALDLLFHELGVSQGDRVFCSDLTFVSSIAPAVHRGAVPVFIDCDETSWTLDPDLLEEALGDAAKKGRLPKAVVAVDLYGQCCDYERIEPLCERFGVPLIIDAAEALGAEYGSRSSKVLKCESAKVDENGNVTDNFRTLELSNFRTSGQTGWAAVYSFNGNKIITTSGGGMVASHDESVIARARKRSQQSREPMAWYEHEELGYNYRMSNIVAAIGVGQLSCLSQIVQKKRQIFEWYRSHVKDVAGFMPEAAYGKCTRWLTVVEISTNVLTCGSSKVGVSEDGRPADVVKRVMAALEAENIESRPVWKPMHLQPVFKDAKVYGGEVGARLFANGVCLPSGAALMEADVERICERIMKALA